ncbi:ABC transporter substrate-binding protein [Maribellus mangrovi]|uniref:ABC transporter substrate-binding protein n=1 Tax=Maribellus mangrovi TaxID=3133146 RepID=UPI0030EC7BAA
MNTKGVKVLLLLLLINWSAFAQKVQRVVSLAPSVTEIIYLIDAQEKLVGCTSYCQVADEDTVAVVGNAVEVNIEALYALQPDIVLAMKLTKQQDVAAMEKLGIKVELMESPRNFEEICGQTLHIAKILGETEKAHKVVSLAKQRVHEIKQLAQKQEHNKIFFQLGANPVFSVLDNTFMNDYITICNGENIAAGLTKGTITRESVLLKDPDVIIIATMGGFGEEEMKVWKSYSGIEAVKNEKVFLIDSETSCSPTPSSFVSALEDVYKFISQ